MRLKREPEQPQRELFQVELEQLIDLHHSGARLQIERVVVRCTDGVARRVG